MSRYHKFFRTIIAALALSCLLPSCKVWRFVVYNFADISDYKKFPSRPLHSDSIKFQFPVASPGVVRAKNYSESTNAALFDKYLEDNHTVAFLIIRHDTIQYEKYFGGYDRESIVPSFSMAKSVTSILIGCAIDDGLIKSVDEPVTAYIPELTKKGFEKVKIRHLLQMTSGIKYNESYYNPFGDAASFYYGQNLRHEIEKMKLKSEPGIKFEYASGNSQLLGLILERALKTKTVTQYLQEKLWTPLGMEYDASWSIDRKVNGLEKTFCCINARARDFAKIGRLYKNNGNWNGKQIVSQKWVEESISIDTTSGGNKNYHYQWWMPSDKGDFMAVGILGQVIYVNPSEDVVIVRLGKKRGETQWWSLCQSIAKGYFRKAEPDSLQPGAVHQE